MGTAGFANPSFPTLWTPPFPTLGDPLRRGIIAAAGLGQYRNPVSGANRESPVRNLVQLFVFGPVSHAFQKISLGFGRSFFIIGGMDSSCLRLLFVLLWFFVGFALTAVESLL